MADNNSEPLFLGVDVGGTNIKMGLVSDSGRILASGSVPTHETHGPDYAIQSIATAVEGLLTQHQLDPGRLLGVGLGTPGPMDIANGMILEPVNMPGWRNFPIRDRLSDALNLPVVYTNDANAAAFGEYWLGSAKACRSLVFFTLGTGVGGGIIVNDQCIEGVHSLGAELGHVRVDWGHEARLCSCGRPGHIEAYSSATALVKRAAEGILAGRATSLVNDTSLTAKRIGEAAEANDAFAVELVRDTALFLARGLEIVAHTIDPDSILIGGAMTFGEKKTRTGRLFLETLVNYLEPTVFPEITSRLTIDFAELGSDAGFIGAAGLARLEHHRHEPTR